MDMWDKFNGVIILILMLISSTSSEEICKIQKLTEVIEHSDFEANLWIKPESDFERIEIHIKVDNLLNLNPPYYHQKHIAIESDSILDSSYEVEPYWIPLEIRVYQKVEFFRIGKRLVLSASVNETKNFTLDDNLFCSLYGYQNYKLLAIGGLSFSRCNPSTFETKTPTGQDTIIYGPLSNGNSTGTNKGDENTYILTPADEQKNSKESFMIIILIVIAILTIILIAAIIFIEWRNKVIEREIEFLRQLPEGNTGQDNLYFASPEGISLATVPPPSYSPKHSRKEIL